MLKDLYQQIQQAMEEQQREQQRQQVVDNVGPMPGPQTPQGGTPMMQGLNIQPGQNPFAFAAHRAGFADFPQQAPPAPQMGQGFSPTNQGGGGKILGGGNIGNMFSQAQALRAGAGNTRGGQNG